MAEEKNEKKVVVAYTVFRNADGSIDVKNAGVEGTTVVSDEEIYKDIEDVARIIGHKRVENAAYVGAYNGTAKFWENVNAAQNKQKDTVDAPTVDTAK